MYALYLVVKQDFKNLVLNPVWDFYCILFPLLLILILGYLGEEGYGGAVTSYQYYFVGCSIYCGFNYGTISANAFMEERIKAGNARIIFAPVLQDVLYLSKLIATFFYGCICMMIVWGISLPLLQLTIPSSAYLPLIATMACTILLGCSFGIFLCCLCKKESITNQIQCIIINLMALMGGIFFPMDGFGELFHQLTMLSPMKWLNQLAWQTIAKEACYDNLRICLIFLCLAALLIWACHKTWKVEDSI